MSNIIPFHISQVFPVYEGILCSETGNWIQEPTFTHEATDPWSWSRNENTSTVQHTTYRVKSERGYRALRVIWQ